MQDDPDATAKRILVIEDEAAIRERIVRMLEYEGFRATDAGDGREGVERARRERPDLIVCDLMMPGLSGFGACRVLRDDPRTADIPIVVLSALTAAADRESVRGLGVRDYVAKPFRNQALLAAVRRSLGLDEG